MDVFKTHGAFSWSELMTDDPEKAAAFYTQLFGWQVEAMDMGGMGTYRVLKVGDAAVGGIMGMPPDTPPGVPPHWGTYVTLDDIDRTVAQCTELGGKVLQPVMAIPNVGRMAVLQDPQGAVIHAIAYDPA